MDDQQTHPAPPPAPVGAAHAETSGNDHGGRQAHGHDAVSDRVARVSWSSWPSITLLSLLGLALCATVAGLVVLWPSAAQVRSTPNGLQYAVPGVTFPDGRVSVVHPACPSTPGSSDSGQGLGAAVTTSPVSCGTISVNLTSGASAGQVVTVEVPPGVSASGLRAGDTVELAAPPPGSGSSTTAAYTFIGVVRTLPVGLLAAAFVLILVAVARLRGLLSVVGLAIGGIVVVKFVLPALITGHSGVAVALVGAAAIMFVVLYTTHGPSLRTSAALAGTLLGLGVTAVVGDLAVAGARLSGVGDDDSATLSSLAGNLDLHALFTAAIIIAGLGVLNDVTITQASAVWELRALAADLPGREVFSRAMRIGRDHIASTVYTIVFAYAGGALPVLLLIALYDQPGLQLLTSESIGEEVVRTLASSIGLVLAVPTTTLIATMVSRPARAGRHGRSAVYSITG